jgi:hypothetical protein
MWLKLAQLLICVDQTPKKLGQNLVNVLVYAKKNPRLTTWATRLKHGNVSRFLFFEFFFDFYQHVNNAGGNGNRA